MRNKSVKLQCDSENTATKTHTYRFWKIFFKLGMRFIIILINKIYANDQDFYYVS